MAYKKVDDNKIIGVDKKGQIIRDVTPIKPDITYDEDGNANWPTFDLPRPRVGGSEERLLPEEVMKLHGDVGMNEIFSVDDFEAIDGDKTNCHVDNITINRGKKANPYKGKGPKDKSEKVTEEVSDKGEEVQEDDKPDSIPEPENKEQTVTGNDLPSGVTKGESGKFVSTDDSFPKDDNEDIGHSLNHTATKAIDIIEDTYMEILQDQEFFNEDDSTRPRKTVVKAWEKKQKQFES